MKKTKYVEISLLVTLFVLVLFIIIPEYITTPTLTVDNTINKYKNNRDNDKYKYLIVLQAGHCTYDNNFKCKKRNTYKSTGTHGYGLKEQLLTVIVAEEAKKHLLNAGVPVNKIKIIGAHTKSFTQLIGKQRIKHFISLHFDGNKRRCRTGTSVGYPSKVSSRNYKNITKSKAYAVAWKTHYFNYYPSQFNKMNDNFSKGLVDFYMYRRTNAETDLLIEFAELTCRKSARWVEKNIDKLGLILALFIIEELNNGN